VNLKKNQLHPPGKFQVTNFAILIKVKYLPVVYGLIIEVYYSFRVDKLQNIPK